MTRQEFYDKYGDVKVKFLSYYKFTFTYVAYLLNGNCLMCKYGGNSSNIYKHEVRIDVDNEESIYCLQPYEGSVFKDGKRIEGFYDY